MATADTHAELDQWRRLNSRAIELLHKQAPSEHSAVMTEIAAAAERIRRGGARREPCEDIDGGYRAAAEWR